MLLREAEGTRGQDPTTSPTVRSGRNMTSNRWGLGPRCGRRTTGRRTRGLEDTFRGVPALSGGSPGGAASWAFLSGRRGLPKALHTAAPGTAPAVPFRPAGPAGGASREPRGQERHRPSPSRCGCPLSDRVLPRGTRPAGPTGAGGWGAHYTRAVRSAYALSALLLVLLRQDVTAGARDAPCTQRAPAARWPRRET